MDGDGLLELFRMEAETNALALEAGLVALDTGRATKEVLEPLMRAAHSLKGAARIVGLDAAVGLAHTMEDVFVAAQRGRITLVPAQVDRLLAGVDVFARLASVDPDSIPAQLSGMAADLALLVKEYGAFVSAPAPASPTPAAGAAPQPQPPAGPVPPPAAALPPSPTSSAPAPGSPAPTPAEAPGSREGSVVVGTGTLDRLTGLAGESLVQAQRAPDLMREFLSVKAALARMSGLLENLSGPQTGERTVPAATLVREVEESRAAFVHALDALERHTLRTEEIADRLYGEAVAARMRPFGEGARGFPRLVRDTGRELGREISLELRGEETRVDRDILALLEAPLTHALRNACDHGIEPAEERIAAGKPRAGRIVLSAEHRAGALFVTVVDDGRGLDPERIRARVADRGLAPPSLLAEMKPAELFEFLFLPGFSTAAAVTQLSGRGVGLDVVQSMVREVGGRVSLTSTAGAGMTLSMQLPLTLSVVRALLFRVSGEAFALPLSRIERVLEVPAQELQTAEGHAFIDVDGQAVGVLFARQPLGLPPSGEPTGATKVVVISDRLDTFGLAVDGFLGERQLVLRPLDPRLGKVPDVAAAALLPDGTPVLVLDAEDLVRSIHALLSRTDVESVRPKAGAGTARKVKRLLVVDDSITVREVERRLLASHGYEVDVAVDGMDGFNRVRTGRYDLVVTDVDMPRMNGIEMVTRIRAEASLARMPIVIVSYKDREEDRLQGLAAGASYYLTKGSFDDRTLLTAVADLIGEP
ncbi:MAG: hybrid sensor histidine kinase/response regulator [Holophagales bacterium]|nr:hybrid sensor histidine kinase/response regulator [Holophagales bacterium]